LLERRLRQPRGPGTPALGIHAESRQPLREPLRRTKADFDHRPNLPAPVDDAALRDLLVECFDQRLDSADFHRPDLVKLVRVRR
jgi:hypothetical protein